MGCWTARLCTRVEKVLEQNHSLEQTKKITFQQHSLYEQEVRSLEGQVDNLKRVSDVTCRCLGQDSPQRIK